MKKERNCDEIIHSLDFFYIVERITEMSDEEVSTNNPMDIDIAPNESSSSPAAATSTAILDIGIGSGYISGSDDEDINEPVTSKSSTPDSTTLPTTVTKKPFTANKHPLTKSLYLFFIKNYLFCFFFCSKIFIG
jgi:hypothetical protein